VLALCASYLVMLLPVIGLVQMGEQAAADRYMYLPLLVPAIGLAALVVRAWQVGPRLRTFLGARLVVAVAGMSILTIRQIGVWRDTPTLWAWVIEKQPRVAVAHYNLGEYLRKLGDLDGAARCWRRAVEIEPSFSWPLNGLGNLAELRGDLGEARSYFERATRTNMYDAYSQYNFATFLEEQGDIAEARAKLSLLGRP